MREIFLKVINMNVLGSCFVLAVLFVRPFLKQASKNMICLLWLLAGIRFLVPFSVESSYGVFPNRTINEGIFYENNFTTETMEAAVIGKTTDQPAYRVYEGKGDSEKSRQMITICSYIWLSGVILLLGYFFCSWYSLKKKTATALPWEYCGEKVYRSEEVLTPFLMGLIKPRIYLPMDLEEDILPYVIAHEKAHRERLDHVIKSAVFLLLTVHWFNPLLWISYILLCRDIEYACDERVIRKLGEERKKDYSTALLLCAAEKTKPALCPVAFGEVSIKGRIKKILNYKKPPLWITAAAVMICVVMTFIFLTQKQEKSNIIEYNGCRITLERAVMCEETGGIIVSFKMESDSEHKADLRDLKGAIALDLSGAQCFSVSEKEDLEYTVSGFYKESVDSLENICTLVTRQGIKIGSFDPAFVVKEQAELFEMESETGKVKIAVAPDSMKMEFEGGIPDRYGQDLPVMNMKQGEIREIGYSLKAQDGEGKIIWLTLSEPVDVEDIESVIDRME